MHNRLNIPLSTKTRQRNWRVLWIVTFFLTLILIGQTLFSIFTSIEYVSSFKPHETQQTLVYKKNSSNIELWREHIGPVKPFQNAPYSLDHYFELTNRYLALHHVDNQIVGISVDKKIPPDSISQLELYGLFIHSSNGSTLITTSNNVSIPKIKLRVRILPQTSDGYLIDHLSNRHSPISLSANGIEIKNANIRKELPPIEPNERLFLARVPLDTSNNQEFIHENVADLFKNGFIEVFTDKNTAYIRIYGDRNASLDDITSFSKELSYSSTVSTTLYTLRDGNRVFELTSTPLEELEATVSDTDFNISYPGHFTVIGDQSMLSIQIEQKLRQAIEIQHNSCNSLSFFADLEALHAVFVDPNTSSPTSLSLEGLGKVQSFGYRSNDLVVCW